MGEIKDGGPAFASPSQVGMTLRDYFAAKAMQIQFVQFGSDKHDSEMAERAYQIADAMLRARSQS